jgi:DNA-directed RNA polymerase subunit RPC12/RpoP
VCPSCGSRNILRRDLEIRGKTRYVKSKEGTTSHLVPLKPKTKKNVCSDCWKEFD